MKEIQKLEAELAEKQKILDELRKKEALRISVREKIEDILSEANLTISEVFDGGGEFISPKQNSPQRERGIPKFKKDGTLYDGRSVRHAPEFAEFIDEGRIDLNAVVKAGLLNPDWLDVQPERVLKDHGISDKAQYKKLHKL